MRNLRQGAGAGAAAGAGGRPREIFTLTSYHQRHHLSQQVPLFRHVLTGFYLLPRASACAKLMRVARICTGGVIGDVLGKFVLVMRCAGDVREMYWGIWCC